MTFILPVDPRSDEEYEAMAMALFREFGQFAHPAPNTIESVGTWPHRACSLCPPSCSP